MKTTSIGVFIQSLPSARARAEVRKSMRANSLQTLSASGAAANEDNVDAATGDAQAKMIKQIKAAAGMLDTKITTLDPAADSAAIATKTQEMFDEGEAPSAILAFLDGVIKQLESLCGEGVNSSEFSVRSKLGIPLNTWVLGSE